MKLDLRPIAIAVPVFLVVMTLYDFALATDLSKASLMIVCGLVFLGASLLSMHSGRVPRFGAGFLSALATLIVASLIVFSLPIPVSLLSVVSGRQATIFNLTEGTLSRQGVVISVDMVNAQLIFQRTNSSTYRILANTTARGLSERGAERLLTRCRLRINTIGGDISIHLTGPRRLQRRLRPVLLVFVPANVTVDLVIRATDASVDLAGLQCGRVAAWLKSGSIRATSLVASYCEMYLDNGPIDLQLSAGKVKLQTIRGNIRIVSLGQQTDCSIESFDGRIETYLNFSKLVDYQIQANSIGGSIYVNLTDVAFTKQTSGYVYARTKDFKSKKFVTKIIARTTTGEVTVAQITDQTIPTWA